jgi:integrase
MKGDDALNISNAKKSDAASSPSTDDVLHSVIATPDKRPRRKSMARRSGQGGYIERKGNAFYVRFRIDVPGQEKRAYKSVRICPALDLPEIKNQNTPTFSTDDVTGIVATSHGQYRVLYALFAGTGLRIGEAAGLEIGDISADGLTCGTDGFKPRRRSAPSEKLTCIRLCPRC